MRWVLAFVLGLLAVDLALAGGPSTRRGTSPAPSPALSSRPGVVRAARCRARDGGLLPDPRCTPGATNPEVIQETIRSTICRKGWAATVRPPVSYTEDLKRVLIADYGWADRRLGDYELDHLVPLELGGNPTDPRNLWPEPLAAARRKDRVEGTLRRLVCRRTVRLATASESIASDWVTTYLRIEGGPPIIQH